MVSKDELISKIEKETGKNRDEIEDAIEKKKTQLPGISETGIIQLVAKEMNVNLNKTSRKVKINEIKPNMRNIEFLGKITSLSPVREFQTSKGSGKVQNITLEDETGRIRMSLWNDEIDNNSFNENDSIMIEQAITREDNMGKPEVRLGYNGKMEKVDKEVKTKPACDNLMELREGDEFQGEVHIISIEPRQFVYKICPECRKKIYEDECQEHGKVEPDKFAVVSTIIDDGNSSSQAVFFDDNAEKIIGMDKNQMYEKTINSDIVDFIEGLDLIGKKIKIKGRARKNRFNEELEISVNEVEI